MQSEAVVLVHGLWLNSFSLHYIARKLNNAGYETITFKYPTVFSSLQDNAAKLYKTLSRLAENKLTIHIAAHSLGGFVVLEALKKGKLENIGSVILLGSPVRGSRVCQKIAHWPYLRGCFGKSLQPLCDGISAPEGYNIVSIAGDGGLGVGHLIAPVPKPHDGAVAVEETKLDNCPHFIIHSSLFTMLMSRKTTDAIVRYLREARFKN